MENKEYTIEELKELVEKANPNTECVKVEILEGVGDSTKIRYEILFNDLKHISNIPATETTYVSWLKDEIEFLKEK